MREYVPQQRVSAGFFRVLGVAPALGREFTADEDRPNGPAVAVLSHRLWMRAVQRRSGVDRPLDHAARRAAHDRRRDARRLHQRRAGRCVDAGAALAARAKAAARTTASSRGSSRASPGRRPTPTSRRSRQPVMRRSLRLARQHRAHQRSCRCSGARPTNVRQPILILWGAVGDGAADRLRQHRGPADGARRGARAGDRDAHGARRRPRRDRPPAADRERRARRRAAASPAWRSATSARALFASLLQDAFGVAPAASASTARAGHHAPRRARHQPRVRPAAGAAGEPRQPARGAGRVGQRVDRGRRAQLAAAGAGGRPRSRSVSCCSSARGC